jgi:hypothetical protein
VTEIVIRFDPARALQSLYSGARSQFERLWRTQPLATRLAWADRRTHVKLGVGALAAISMLLIYSVSRGTPAAPPSEFRQRLDQSLQDTGNAASLRKSDMDRAVRQIEINRQLAPPVPETKLVQTERIMPDAAEPVQTAMIPPRQTDDEEEVVRPRRRYASRSTARGDVCTRHGLKKVITRGGKSWRCGKR